MTLMVFLLVIIGFCLPNWLSQFLVLEKHDWAHIITVPIFPSHFKAVSYTGQLQCFSTFFFLLRAINLIQIKMYPISQHIKQIKAGLLFSLREFRMGVAHRCFAPLQCLTFRWSPRRSLRIESVPPWWRGRALFWKPEDLVLLVISCATFGRHLTSIFFHGYDGDNNIARSNFWGCC